MKLIISLIVSLMFFNLAHSQSFAKRFSAYGVSSVDSTANRGFIFSVNDTTSGPGCCFRRFFIVTDSLGNFITALTTDSMRVFNVLHTVDKGYVLIGAKSGYEYLPDTVKIIIIKTDSSFNVEWQFGIMSADSTANVAPIFNNYDSTISVVFNNSIYRYTLTGNLLFGVKYNKEISQIIPTQDNGYFFSSLSDSSIVKTDSYGNIIWSKSILHHRTGFISQVNDGGYVINEGFYRHIPPEGLLIVHKIDSLGQPIWARRYFSVPFDPAAGSLLSLSDGTILMASVHCDAVLTPIFIHIDSAGNVISASHTLLPISGYIRDLMEIQDGFVYINSNTTAYFAYQDNFDSSSCMIPAVVTSSSFIDTLINTSINVFPAAIDTFQSNCSFYIFNASTTDECVPVNVPVIDESEISISPNPMHDYFYLKAAFAQPAILTIYDLTGRILLSNTISSNMNGELVRIELIPGIYLVTVQSENYYSTEKIIVE